MRTCSAFTTSMITPPFNMRASPVFWVKESALPFEALPLVVVGSSFAILPLGSLIICNDERRGGGGE